MTEEENLRQQIANLEAELDTVTYELEKAEKLIREGLIEPKFKDMPYYSVTIVWSEEEKAFVATSPQCPGYCRGEGQTRARALEALEKAVEIMRDTLVLKSCTEH